MVFSTLLPFWHPKYHPEMIGFTAVFMVWRAGAPPSPLLAPKWGKLVNFNEFNGFSQKTLKWRKMWFLGHFNPQTPKNHPFHPFDPLWCRNPYIGIPYIGIPYIGIPYKGNPYVGNPYIGNPYIAPQEPPRDPLQGGRISTSRG